MSNLPLDHNEFALAAEAAQDNMNGWIEEEEEDSKIEEEEDPKMEEDEEEEIEIDDEIDDLKVIIHMRLRRVNFHLYLLSCTLLLTPRKKSRLRPRMKLRLLLLALSPVHHIIYTAGCSGGGWCNGKTAAAGRCCGGVDGGNGVVEWLEVVPVLAGDGRWQRGHCGGGGCHSGRCTTTYNHLAYLAR
nr:hypothetical protein [Tanacetum cinerariifolium]